jgi:hypothetical protein
MSQRSWDRDPPCVSVDACHILYCLHSTMESVRINELDSTRENLRKYQLEHVFKQMAPLNKSVTLLPLPQHKKIQNNKYYWS